MNIASRTLAVSATLCAALLGAPAFAQYAYQPADLPTAIPADADMVRNAWTNLTSSAIGSVTGSFPGSVHWSGVASQVDTSSGDVGTSLGGASLGKTAGSGYGAGAGIYLMGFSTTPNTFGATLAVTDTTPLAGLTSVSFDVAIGEAYGYALYNGAAPTLSYTVGGQSYSKAASFSALLSQTPNGTFSTPDGLQNLFINQYGYTWDMRGVSDVSSLTVSFSGAQHAVVYGMTMTQVAAVPEPETYAMMLAGLASVFAIARRRKPRA